MKIIHFMGIGGSGISAAAVLAKSQNFQVTGCDELKSTPYLDKVRHSGIKVYFEHSEKHLENIDLLVITPAVLKRNIPEIKKAKKVITWQRFVGEYLQKGKKVICISGTHGKSTTTAMAACLLEDAKFNPWALVGATVKKWKTNYRVGKSKYFITEADEYNNNFLNYNPSVIILNNIEMDHPDFFKDKGELLNSFKKHIKNLIGEKLLIVNWDDKGVRKLLEKNPPGVNLLKYGINGNCEYIAKNIILGKNFSFFEVDGLSYKLQLPGAYNISNALGVIALGKFLKIKDEIIQKSLAKFEGVERRMDLIGHWRGIKIYDDYAHHPTAIRVTLDALKQKHPHARIWAIVEPHSYSRTKTLLPYYKNCFFSASLVIITKIFKARDTQDFGVSGQDIVRVSRHKNIRYIADFKSVAEYFWQNAKKKDVAIVMGAGESYKLARMLLKKNYAN